MANDQKKALIVVDVQNDFCPGGSLAVANGDEVVAPLNELMKEFLERGEPVFKTRDWHPATAKHFAVYGGIWPVHCVRNTPGAEFHPELVDDPRITIISKGIDESADGYSGFDGTKLAARTLARLRAFRPILVSGGVCTSGPATACFLVFAVFGQITASTPRLSKCGRLICFSPSRHLNCAPFCSSPFERAKISSSSARTSV